MCELTVHYSTAKIIRPNMQSCILKALLCFVLSFKRKQKNKMEGETSAELLQIVCAMIKSPGGEGECGMNV